MLTQCPACSTYHDSDTDCDTCRIKQLEARGLMLEDENRAMRIRFSRLRDILDE